MRVSAVAAARGHSTRRRGFISADALLGSPYCPVGGSSMLWALRVRAPTSEMAGTTPRTGGWPVSDSRVRCAKGVRGRPPSSWFGTPSCWDVASPVGRRILPEYRPWVPYCGIVPHRSSTAI